MSQDVEQAQLNAAGMAYQAAQMALTREQELAFEMVRPSYLYRPKLSIDGDQWCALYGENLQEGVAGFGKSPAEAYAAFDVAWREPLKATQGEHVSKKPEEKTTRLMPIQAWFKLKENWPESRYGQLYVERDSKGGKPTVRRWDEDKDEAVKVALPKGTKVIYIPDSLVPELWEDHLQEVDETGVWFVGLEEDVNNAKALLEQVKVLCAT